MSTSTGKYKSITWKKKSNDLSLPLDVIYHIRQSFPLKYVNFLNAEECDCLKSHSKGANKLKVGF